LDLSPKPDVLHARGLSELLKRFLEQDVVLLSESDSGPLVDLGVRKDIRHVGDGLKRCRFGIGIFSLSSWGFILK
jgi:hypothetical protein